jgi:hypothetical protein
MPDWRNGSKYWVAASMLGVSANVATADELWQTQLAYKDSIAAASIDVSGYRLTSAGVERAIPRQPASTTTASVLFDALFALAQQELEQARVTQIIDGAFNDGKPVPCECLQTGEKWTYVWTRDLAYATDLALFRFAPVHARNGLEFKLSGVRAASGSRPTAARATYIVQDTGSGGSWPISTDRIVWFLGARHLLDDAKFADKVYKALHDTLTQDRLYVFDGERGLYRGETSFLDWREQSYPGWTAKNVTFIAESFALSTNVLYYQALRLAATIAQSRHDPLATQYRQQANALRTQIGRQFWREERGLYASYIGGANAPRSIEAYDLLGTSLAIIAGVAPAARARRALANYPTWDAGSPVIWPEHRDAPIYHNRAIWPFVSAYALKAARELNEPVRIAHELRSILRGAALAGSNMENYELTTQAVHVEDGQYSGPVVNSKRQLWSVAATLDMVVEGVFGLTDRDMLEPKIPRELAPMLFGDRDEIHLDLTGRRITLVKPIQLAAADNLLIAAKIIGTPVDTRVQLRGVHVATKPLPLARPMFAPATPDIASVVRDGAQWRVRTEARTEVQLYVNGEIERSFTGETTIAAHREQQCISLARREDDIESLPSTSVCVGDTTSLAGEWPRQWTAPKSGRYLVRLDYRNLHGPINTGITAAVKTLVVQCTQAANQRTPLVMPHSIDVQQSTAATFIAQAGQRCEFSLAEGFNMSFLEHYARYTGGEGGAHGAVNSADYAALQITPLHSPP